MNLLSSCSFHLTDVMADFKTNTKMYKAVTERGIAWCETFIKAVSCNLFRKKFDRSRENDVRTNRIVRCKYNLPTYLGTGNDNLMFTG